MKGGAEVALVIVQSARHKEGGRFSMSWVRHSCHDRTLQLSRSSQVPTSILHLPTLHKSVPSRVEPLSLGSRFQPRRPLSPSKQICPLPT